MAQMLHFGVHRGSHIDQVDDGYLEWIVSNFPELNSCWKAAASRRKMTQQQFAKSNVRDLKSCTRKKDLQKGRRVHANAVEAGIDSNIYVVAALTTMYAKCDSMVNARTVFDSIQDPDVVSWTALILGYADNGQGLVALELFSRMKDEGKCAPDSMTYLAALKACTSLAPKGVCLERCRQIHLEIGCHMDHFLQSMLISLYAKCGSMDEARTVFNCIPEPDVVCWNAVIVGYADHGQGLVALDLFSRMKGEGRCAPAYLAALKACTSLAVDGSEAGKAEGLERGRKIHSEIGCHIDHFMQSMLITLYSKCGSMEDARTVFDSVQEPDVVAWNALILGYADNGQGPVALDLFSRMKGEGRAAPDSLTYLAALKACTSLAATGGLERGRQIHSEIGDQMDHFVQSILINLYTKCGSMQDARTVFDSIQEPDVVSWTALILGHVENGQGLAALDLFSRMKDEGRCAPNSLTYLAALMACSSVGALAIGRRIHSVIREFDSRIVTCLVDFYAKCGSMEEAREVFELHPRLRDISTWNALLAGYAGIGDTSSAFVLFQAMQDQGFQPNDVTFVCMLPCCSDAGLIARAWEYLEVMPTRYGVTPALKHYNCMIDLLGRANKLDEAVALLQKMPCDPDEVTWKTLLGSCRKWKNAEIGRWAFKALMDLDKKSAPAYVLMAEIYGSRGMWEEQERVILETKKLSAKPRGR